MSDKRKRGREGRSREASPSSSGDMEKGEPWRRSAENEKRKGEEGGGEWTNSMFSPFSPLAKKIQGIPSRMKRRRKLGDTNCR